MGVDEASLRRVGLQWMTSEGEDIPNVCKVVQPRADGTWTIKTLDRQCILAITGKTADDVFTGADMSAVGRYMVENVPNMTWNKAVDLLGSVAKANANFGGGKLPIKDVFPKTQPWKLDDSVNIISQALFNVGSITGGIEETGRPLVNSLFDWLNDPTKFIAVGGLVVGGGLVMMGGLRLLR